MNSAGYDMEKRVPTQANCQDPWTLRRPAHGMHACTSKATCIKRCATRQASQLCALEKSFGIGSVEFIW